MTQVLITVDTELSPALHQRGVNAADNFASSILGRCADGEFGIEWQMRTLDRHGLKAVFFIDPLPALVLGEAVIADAVRRVIDGGHDVQLHAHTEWLAWGEQSPVDGRQGGNIGDFDLGDQVALLSYGCEILKRTGAPRPVAFRAGNFGADDRTLAALARLGLRYDSSVNPHYLGGACRVSAPPSRNLPYEHADVIELPVSGIEDRPGHFRPAQICALSSREMVAALRHAAATEWPVFTIVTHSFEMLSRDRMRANRTVIDRFERMATEIARNPALTTATFSDLKPVVREEDLPRLAASLPRTLRRHAEQAWAMWRYERRPLLA